MTGLVLVFAYLLGTIPFALGVARRLHGTDIRRAGSGNPGAANVLRTTRPALGLTVLILDVGKGAAAVSLAWRLAGSEPVAATAAGVAVIGHMFPVWLRFRGGKGVATAAGAFAVLAPGALTIAMAAFAALVWKTRYVSLGSLAAAILLPALVMGLGGPPATARVALIVAALVVARHRSNMARLWAGTERRVSASPAVRRQRA